MTSEAKTGLQFLRQQYRKRQLTSKQKGTWEAGKTYKHFHIREVWKDMVNTTIKSP
jgi:hypothetical protein